MMTSTSTATASAVAWPVTRSTRVSAMICPRVRGSPAAILVSASLVSAAWAATPCASGSSPVSRVIVSGAGRRPTRRSFSALRRSRRRLRGRAGTRSCAASAATRRSPEFLEPRREFPVDLRPVLAGQPRRLARHQHGPPLGGHAGLQRRQGAGQFAGQDLGPAEVAAGLERGAAPRQPDLFGDAAARPGRPAPLCRSARPAARRRTPPSPALAPPRSPPSSTSNCRIRSIRSSSVAGRAGRRPAR